MGVGGGEEEINLNQLRNKYEKELRKRTQQLDGKQKIQKIHVFDNKISSSGT